LKIGVKTLSDALAPFRSAPKNEYLFDCDTGSLIYISIAEEIGLPISLVEITLPGGAGHNYIRWNFDADNHLDWDTNGRSQCRTPSDLSQWQGVSMTRSEVLGYSIAIRAGSWKKEGNLARAIQDYGAAIWLHQRSPEARNNLAWLYVTNRGLQSIKPEKEALRLALEAVKIEEQANYLDTLACAYAANGDFGKAIEIQKKTISRSPSEEFLNRLAGFQSPAPRNCLEQAGRNPE